MEPAEPVEPAERSIKRTNVRKKGSIKGARLNPRWYEVRGGTLDGASSNPIPIGRM